MSSGAAALGRLHDELVAFAHLPERRLLVIETEDELRIGCLERIDTLDVLTKEPSLVSVFEAPWMAGDPCWDARHDELQDEWESLTRAFQRDIRAPLPALPDPGARDLASFARRLGFASAKVAPHFPVLFVALAPLAIEAPATWAQDVSTLMVQKSLATCRWVVCAVGPSGLGGLVAQLGKAATLVRIASDEQADAASMKAALAAMKTAPPGAPAVQFAGGVGPRVAPPARPNATAAPAQPQMAAALTSAKLPAGLSEAAAMQEVRVSVMEGALAAADKDYTKAIAAQRRARTTTARLGMTSETATLDLMLGSYALMAGQPKLGLEVFTEVEQRAQAAGLGALAVQAAMSRAGALSLLDRRLDAAAAFAEGGKTGVRFGAHALAVESFGMAGQMLAELNDPRRALLAWNEALSTAERAKPEDVAGTSVLQTADKGIALLRQHGATGEAATWTRRRAALSQAIEAAAAKGTA